jgi:hypothetical protein
MVLLPELSRINYHTSNGDGTEQMALLIIIYFSEVRQTSSEIEKAISNISTI